MPRCTVYPHGWTLGLDRSAIAACRECGTTALYRPKDIERERFQCAAYCGADVCYAFSAELRDACLAALNLGGLDGLRAIVHRAFWNSMTLQWETAA